jgi:antibiotic biosynthesis monooxygenase (ABM) superfamily enzyme
VIRIVSTAILDDKIMVWMALNLAKKPKKGGSPPNERILIISLIFITLSHLLIIIWCKKLILIVYSKIIILIEIIE